MIDAEEVLATAIHKEAIHPSKIDMPVSEISDVDVTSDIPGDDYSLVDLNDDLSSNDSALSITVTDDDLKDQEEEISNED